MNRTKKLPNLALYKSYDDFKANRKSLNGCSAEWLQLVGLTFEEADKSLVNCEGCWDCKYCTDCKYCRYCYSCIKCYNFRDGNKCENCTYCSYCYHCTDCYMCIKSVRAKRCETCYEIEDCKDCNNLYRANFYSNNKPTENS